MNRNFRKLLEYLAEIDDLEQVRNLLSWDQATYMPPEGANARGRQSGTLSRIYQERSSDPALGRLLDALQPFAESLEPDSFEASLIRVVRRDYEKAVRIPPKFMEEFNNHQAQSFQVWITARARNDFAAVRPYLEKTLELSRRLANYFPGYEHIADPLINFSDYGMKASSVGAIFNELRQALVPMVFSVLALPPADNSFLKQSFPQTAQLTFASQVAAALGYDFQRGRLDLTFHPFTTRFSLGDVRITTHVNPGELSEALMGTIHETGHALYEQGIDRAFEGTSLATGTSSGVHESQSRLWENLVGRSRGFWEYFFPRLQAVYPDQLGKLPLDDFYRAINKVKRSLIRTEADELTYNLHVMIRFDLELALLEGSLEVRDLPQAWNDRYEHDLGIRPVDDKNGVMQDVHWYDGRIGGVFQGYTLGNIMGALFYTSALQAHPEIPGEMREGRFTTLHAWLGEKIYQHGRKFTASELVQRISGSPITINPYIKYLKDKYEDLYGVSL
jgi:carboxypeptidase Taq